MIFRQILHPATGCASYIFGCTGKRALVVVDPHLEHVDDYLAVAAEAQSPIIAILETHVQSDHRSGAVALAERTGAPIYLHEAAAVAFPHRSLHDGEEITLGNDYLRVLHTPGHSLDSICLLAGDRVRGEDPWFLLTGDTLFVGDAGRPDLTASEDGYQQADSAPPVEARQAALTLYASLQLPPSMRSCVPKGWSAKAPVWLACGRWSSMPGALLSQLMLAEKVRQIGSVKCAPTAHAARSSNV